MRIARVLFAGPATVLAVLAGCGGGSGGSTSAVNPNAKEHNPPGDIPDNQVFVPYRPGGGGFVVKVPEGWARRVKGSTVTFTGNLNSVAVQSLPAQRAPTIAAVRRTLVPQLAKTTSGFRLVAVNTLRRPAGPAVHLVYQSASKANAVTGKRSLQTVERYLFFHNGREVVLTLAGPRGADNVDPWRTVSTSLRWTG
jgi:hypothetical protein